MKNKYSIIIYAIIGSVFAGLSLFTDLFDRLQVEALFSHFGLLLGLAISASVLISIAKGFLQTALNTEDK